jgi:hypothetical protein
MVNPQISHLYAYLQENGYIVDLKSKMSDQLRVKANEVLRMIESGDKKWEKYVPLVVANTIKKKLKDKGLLQRQLHIVSANMHSVMNALYASDVFPDRVQNDERIPLYQALSDDSNIKLRKQVQRYASKNGLIYIEDSSGTNINVQIIDTAALGAASNSFDLRKDRSPEDYPVILVMDYAFGEQAYETMDELLKPYYDRDGNVHKMPVESVSIMGKAGILEGKKGDIMIPSSHIFEGTADNYPFKNRLRKKMFDGCGVDVYSGTMVTVLGTSLQNRDLLRFFHGSTWQVIGLEMEGAHYQKAIQAASKIRGNIPGKVKVRYAYYASDNPLKSGSTLASGGLGMTGVLPTYVITEKILEQIFES